MPSPWAQRLVSEARETQTEKSDMHTLWAVLTDLDWKGNETGRSMAILGNYTSYAAAVADHALADKRMRKGRKQIRQRTSVSGSHMLGGNQRLEYLAVRASNDPDWPRRYPNVPGGRWTALLARKGSLVRVTIYGNSYTGTVTTIKDLTAEVRFKTLGDAAYMSDRVKGFTILPESPFARGLQSVVRR